MWRQALEWAGVDAGQCRALVKTGLRLDFRKPAIDGRGGRRSGRGPVATLAGSLLIYLVSGVFFGVFAFFIKDLLVAGTLVVSAIMFMVAATILVEFHAVVISPDDHAVLGHFPISSTTYFAARLANLLFYVVVLATALGLPSMVGFCFNRGFRPLIGLAAVAAVYLSAITVALAMVGLYASLLHVVRPARLRRVLSYVQIVLSMAVYGSYLFLPQLMNREVLAGLVRVRSPWLLANPAAWFACYLELASGRAGVGEVVPAAASVLLLAGLGALAIRYLSLDYSERLSALAASGGGTAGPRAKARRAWLFREGEGRAVALLVRSQFRHDMKFRLGVLSIVPLTVFYFLYGLRDGPMPDPFAAGGKGAGQWFMLHFAMLSFPLMLLPSLGRSDAFRASWVFFATPASKPRLILGMKNFVMAFFVLPYLSLVGCLLAFFIASPIHVVIHIAVLALVGHITLQVAIRLLPHLPFSRPVQKGERTAGFLGLFIVTSIIAGILFPVLTHWVYRSPPRAVLTMAGLAAISLVLERALAARLGRLTDALEATA